MTKIPEEASPAPAHERPDSCIIPGDPIPAEVLANYSPVRDPHAESDVANYVMGQARDEAVIHVEKVKSEFVMGDEYEVWDVTTDKTRWWVISNPLNLYSRAHFQSLDYTLSFHVGLMLRVRSAQPRSSTDVDDPSPFDEVTRRHSQADDRFNRAVEAEDFQAVGMQLRECLLSLVAAVRRRTDLSDAREIPKDADFVGWSDLLLNKLCGGSSNKTLRQYVKSNAERTWQLVNHLTHDRDAATTTAYIALHACDAVIAHFLKLQMRQEADAKDACPHCASRDIRTHFDYSIEPDGRYYNTCGVCAWSNHPEATEAKSANIDGESTC